MWKTAFSPRAATESFPHRIVEKLWKLWKTLISKNPVFHFPQKIVENVENFLAGPKNRPPAKFRFLPVFVTFWPIFEKFRFFRFWRFSELFGPFFAKNGQAAQRLEAMFVLISLTVSAKAGLFFIFSSICLME